MIVPVITALALMAGSPYWQQQVEPDCVEQTARIAIDTLTQHRPTQQQVDAYAARIGLYAPGVGSGSDYRRLVAHWGLKAAAPRRMSKATLKRNLTAGRVVIAYVNADTLWLPLGWTSGHGTVGQDHVVIVEAVGNGTVSLVDTGIGPGNGEVQPWSTFSKAWRQGGYKATVVS